MSYAAAAASWTPIQQVSRRMGCTALYAHPRRKRGGARPNSRGGLIINFFSALSLCGDAFSRTRAIYLRLGMPWGFGSVNFDEPENDRVEGQGVWAWRLRRSLTFGFLFGSIQSGTAPQNSAWTAANAALQVSTSPWATKCCASAPPLSPKSCSPKVAGLSDPPPPPFLRPPTSSDQATTAAPAPAGSDVVRRRTGTTRGQSVPLPGAAHTVSIPPSGVSGVQTLMLSRAPTVFPTYSPPPNNRAPPPFRAGTHRTASNRRSRASRATLLPLLPRATSSCNR